MSFDLEFALASPADLQAARAALKKGGDTAFLQRIGKVPDVEWSFSPSGGFLEKFVAKGALIELNEDESHFMGRPISAGAFTLWRFPDHLTEELAKLSPAALSGAVSRANSAGYKREWVDQLVGLAKRAISARKDIYAFVYAP
jgi:hypothetical protein